MFSFGLRPHVSCSLRPSSTVVAQNNTPQLRNINTQSFYMTGLLNHSRNKWCDERSSLSFVSVLLCSWLRPGLLDIVHQGLFPCWEGQSSFNPAVLLVVRTQRINGGCPAYRHGKAANKFTRGSEEPRNNNAGLVSQLLTRWGAFPLFYPSIQANP